MNEQVSGLPQHFKVILGFETPLAGVFWYIWLSAKLSGRDKTS